MGNRPRGSTHSLLEDIEIPTEIKAVIVGDSSSGKTCSLITFATDSFPGKEYIPTILDCYEAKLMANGHLMNLSFWDNSGDDAYRSLRKLSYQNADVFIVCFSLAEDDSTMFYGVRKWVSEIRNVRMDLI